MNSTPLLAPVTATLSGTSVGSTAQAWWYFSSSLQLTVGHNSASTITCSAGCVVVTGITGFPPDSTHLWNTSFISLAWSAIVESTMDKRTLRNTVIAAGSGVSNAYDHATGIQTLSTDPTITPRYFAGSGSPTSAGYTTCTAGRDIYSDTTGAHFWWCDATNTWKQSDGISGTDVQNFPLASYTEGLSGWTPGPVYTSSGVSSVWSLNTGPGAVGTIKSNIGVRLPSATQFLYVAKTALPTWSAAAGTVDVTVSATNADGAPSAGNWVLNFYVGCAGSTNGTYSYGTVSTVTVAPPNALGAVTNYTATGLNPTWKLRGRISHAVLDGSRRRHRGNDGSVGGCLQCPSSDSRKLEIEPASESTLRNTYGEVAITAMARKKLNFVALLMP